MRRIYHISLLSLLLLVSGISVSQNMDSLKTVLKNAKDDTTRCTVLNAIVNAEGDVTIWPKYNEQLKTICESHLKTLSEKNPLHTFYSRHLSYCLNNAALLKIDAGDAEGALDYLQKGLKIQERIHDSAGVAMSLNNIGGLYNSRGEILQAMDYYQRSLDIQQKIGEKVGMANSLVNIGVIYNHQGDIPKALDYYHRSLKIQEEIGDKHYMATTLNNIGFIYDHQGDIEKGLEYYNKALQKFEEVNDKKGTAMALNNMGAMFCMNGDTAKGLSYYEKSLKIKEDIGDKQGISVSLLSIGLIHYSKGDYKTSLAYSERSLKIAEEINAKESIALSLNDVALTYLQLGEIKKAQIHGEKSLKLANELGFIAIIRKASKTLSKIYAASNNWKNAFEMEVLYKQMSDSLVNENNRKASLQKSFQYAYDKKVAADSVKTVEERKIFDAKIQQEKTQRIALYSVIGLVAIFSAFMYNRFRLTRKQKAIIELQKTIVEEKQKEVLDSIRYAKRIQTALLPSEKYLEKVIRKIKSENGT